MQVKFGEGVKIMIPAEITMMDYDKDGPIYGVESDWYHGITYCRESDIAEVNGHNVRGIVPEAVIEDVEQEEKTGKKKIAPAQTGIKTEAQAAKKSEKPRKKPGPKPKAAAKPEKTEAPKESLKGTNAAKSSSTSGTPELKKDGTPKKKPGPKPKKEAKEAAPAGQQEKAAPRQQEKKEDSEMVKLAKELAESVED